LIRAVVDPSVLVSAFIGDPGAGPSRLVAAWADRRFVLVVSPLLLHELAEVLARPKFAGWAGDRRAEAYVAAFRARSEHRVDPPERASAGVRDPDDDYLVALMQDARADFLVSVDRDLLDARLPEVTVVVPTTFLSALERS
jgi:uncharacterized protein